MENYPKVLSKKPVFHANLFEVDEVELLLASGKKRTHHNVKREPTVSVFPLTENFEVYLVSQYRYLQNTITIEAMSGFVNKNEEAIAAAKRELKEETGLVAAYWKQLSVIELAGSVIRSQIYLFVAKDLQEGETAFDDDEDITLVKLPLKEAVAKILQGEINHAGSVIGILLLDRLKKEGKL